MSWKVDQPPAFTFVNNASLRYELFLNYSPHTLEMEIVIGAADVEWSQIAFKIAPHPIIHFEGENVRGSADFKD